MLRWEPISGEQLNFVTKSPQFCHILPSFRAQMRFDALDITPTLRSQNSSFKITLLSPKFINSDRKSVQNAPPK